LKKLPENNKVRFKLQKQKRQQKFKLPNNTGVRFNLSNNNKIRFKLQKQQQQLGLPNKPKYSNRQQNGHNWPIPFPKKGNGHLDFAQ
jgi:hypothetical protein